MNRTAVIGAGIAGLSTALMLSEAGYAVTLFSRGIGGLLQSNGTIDVLGWENGRADKTPVTGVDSAFARFTAENPHHPYAQIGLENVKRGIAHITQKLDFFPSYREEEKLCNVLLPTAVGSVRPTAVLPESMRHSVLKDGGEYLLAGFDRLKDFPLELAADNLRRNPLVRVKVRTKLLDLPIRGGIERDANATVHARAFDSPDSALRGELCRQLREEIRPGETVLVPAVLGLRPQTFREISGELAVPVGEIPLPPPSVGGRRISDALLGACRENRVDIRLNSTVVGAVAQRKKILALKVRQAGRVAQIPVQTVTDAAGRYESGSIVRDSYGKIKESIFGLPLFSPDIPGRDFAAEKIYRTGVAVNRDMNPVDEFGKPVFTNLFCAGDILGGSLPWDEKSGEGIALGSAAAVFAAIEGK